MTVAPDRIEVRFASAKEAVVRLFALAQVLTNDYERFETIVGKGERSADGAGGFGRFGGRGHGSRRRC